MNLLHQFKFTIRRHKTNSLLRIKPCQVYALMEGHIIKLNSFTTAKYSIIKEKLTKKKRNRKIQLAQSDQKL